MQIGDTYEYKNVVTKEITAGALGSGETWRTLTIGPTLLLPSGSCSFM